LNASAQNQSNHKTADEKTAQGFSILLPKVQDHKLELSSIGSLQLKNSYSRIYECHQKVLKADLPKLLPEWFRFGPAVC
jgi:hypothetical protein